MSKQELYCGIGLAVSAVIGYLLGGINWAIILTRIVQRKDIRNQGSGNAGMTNVLRSVGKLPALLTFVGDFLKCVTAVLLGQLVMRWVMMSPAVLAGSTLFYSEVFQYARYLAGAACVVGHIFPIYYGFRGGKGIVAAAAMILLVDWRVFLLVIATFLVLFIARRIISLASVVCAAAYPVYTFLVAFFLDYGGSPWAGNKGHSLAYLLVATGAALFIGVLVLVKHRANIGRLLRGQEKPIIGKGK